jgi:hypothetical protein
MRMAKRIAKVLFNKRMILGILLICGIAITIGVSYYPLTIIQNRPAEMILNAQIKVTVGNESFVWNKGDSMPTAFKEKEMNGTLSVTVTIKESNVDVLFIKLKVEGPVPGEFNLTESQTDVWIYDYDTTILTDGTYIFRLEGSIDTAPLYASTTLGGGISIVTYTAFNVIWNGNTGFPSELYGFPTEYVIIGGGVLILLVFTGKKRQEGQTIIIREK